MNTRNSVIIIVAPINGVLSFHFTARGMLRREVSGAEIWFPLADDNPDTLFRTVELALVANRVAHNVTSITKIRDNNGESADYEVIYNLHQGA